MPYLRNRDGIFAARPARRKSRAHGRGCRSGTESPRNIAILGIDELSEADDKLTVSRARKIQCSLSQPFFVAEAFTGSKGKYVKLPDTVKGFKMIIDGKMDDVHEQAF